MKGIIIRYPIVVATGILLVAILIGCETEMDAHLESGLTLQAKQAIEVLPADVQVVTMVNLQEMKRNPHTNPFRSGISSGPFFQSESAARLQDFLKATGFDPEKDLRELYVALGESDQKAISMAAYASFDRERLARYVEENLGNEFETFEYQGVRVYRGSHTGNPMFFALVNTEMIVASQREDHVFAMIDRLSGEGESLEDNSEMMQLITQASGSAWFVIHNVSGFQYLEERTTEMEQLGRAVRDVVVSVNSESDGLSGIAYLTPIPEVSTEDLADLARGTIAAMKVSAPEEARHRTEVFDQVRIRKSGDQVHIRFNFENKHLQHTAGTDK